MTDQVVRDGKTVRVPDVETVMVMIARHAYRMRIARFYVHKLRCKMYGDAVRRGELSAEDAAEHYRRAMVNFDELMDTDLPNWGETFEHEMAKGFSLDG